MTAERQRRSAAFLQADGDLPGAERLLTQVIDGLHGAQAGVPRERWLLQYCRALVDRAGERRYANDSLGAHQDLAEAETLLASALPATRGAVLSSLLHLQAKLHLDPISAVYDLNAAEARMHELSRLGSWPWLISELAATLAERRGDWEGVITHAQPTLRALSSDGWKTGVAFMQKRLGQAYLRLGRLQEAESELLAATAHVQAHGPLDTRPEVELLLAELRCAQGDHDTAWSYVERALEVQARVTRHFRALEDQRRYTATRLAMYRTAFEVAMAGPATARTLRAWSVVERSKSAYLCQIVRNAHIPLFSGVDPALTERLDALEREQEALDREPGNGAKGERTAKDAALYAERQVLINRIMRQNERWAAVHDARPFELATSLEKLHDRGWTPLSYYFHPRADGGADMHVFTCDANGAPQHLVEQWSPDELARLRLAQSQLRGLVSTSKALVPGALTRKLLPEPLRAWWPAKTQLLVSPHGEAHRLPLHALGSAPRRLCDEYPVQYIPTLALLSSRKARSDKRALLALGCVENRFSDPALEEVDEELRAVEQAWRGPRDGVVVRALAPDEDLTSAGVPLSQWGGYSHLHIACHGVFPEGRPFDAALRLGCEAVTASELFAARLSAELVSFSACEVGQHTSGSTGSSEEWLGLYLPLFHAGASQVLVSLWAADSGPAARLMTELHRHLAEGTPAAIALKSSLPVVQSDPAASWANWYLVGLPFADEEAGDEHVEHDGARA